MRTLASTLMPTMTDLDRNATHLVTEARTSGVAGAGRAALDFRERGVPDGAVRTALVAAVPALAATGATDVAQLRLRLERERGVAQGAPAGDATRTVTATAADAAIATEAQVLAQSFTGALRTHADGYGAFQYGLEGAMTRMIDHQVQHGQPIADAVAEQTGLLVTTSPAEQAAMTQRVLARLIAPPAGESYPNIRGELRPTLRLALRQHLATPDADIGLLVHAASHSLPVLEQRARPAPRRVVDASPGPVAHVRDADATEDAPSVPRTPPAGIEPE